MEEAYYIPTYYGISKKPWRNKGHCTPNDSKYINGGKCAKMIKPQ